MIGGLGHEPNLKYEAKLWPVQINIKAKKIREFIFFFRKVSKIKFKDLKI
jgi:hypothetical protein